MKQKIACVYLIENLTNGKKYIGQTVNFQRRKNGHKKDSKTSATPLYKSIRKYGWENFEFIILIKDHTINYNFLSIPLIICTRICMENEIDFKSNLVKDMLNFVQKIDLKTINFIN